MGNIASKVLPHNNMPSGRESSIKLLLDLRSDVFLDVVLVERGGRDVDGVLLHLLGHVDVLDDGLWGAIFVVRDDFAGRGGCYVAFLCH